MKQKVIELNDVTCVLGKTNVGLYEKHLIDTAGIDAPLDLAAILLTRLSEKKLKRRYYGEL